MNTRQISSTSYPIPFLMVLASDHVTGATGKTVTVTLSKNGAAFGAAAGSVTEISSGWYLLAANATDRNTLGTLAIHATATACDPMDATINIVNWDEMAGLPITVTPAVVSVNTGIVTTHVEVAAKTNAPALAFTVTDSTGAAINLSGATVRLKVYDPRTPTSILFSLATGGSGIVVSGASSNVCTCTFTAANTATAGAYAYELYRDDSTVQELVRGAFNIVETVRT